MPVQSQYFGEMRVDDPARAGRDAGPVPGRRHVARVEVVADRRLEQLLEQLVLARLLVGRRPVRAGHDAARRRRRLGAAVAGGQALDELGADHAAPGAGVVGRARRAVRARAAEAVGRDRVDQRDRGDGVVDREQRGGGAAGRPAGDVHRAVDAERGQQRVGVVGPVAQAARGVDRLALAVAEAAHVRSDQAVAVGRFDVREEAAGREVSVQQHDGDPVLGPRLDEVRAQAPGVDDHAPSSSRRAANSARSSATSRSSRSSRSSRGGPAGMGAGAAASSSASAPRSCP